MSVILGFAAIASAAPQRQFGGAGISVSDDVNFQGATETFRDDVPDLRAFRFNDRISSLVVAPGESWEVCDDVNYGGRCIVVSGSERDLRARGLNDVITSMRRLQGREVRRDRDDRDRDDRDDRDNRGVGGITVSDDVNFEGTTATFRRDIPDLRDVFLNDRISSLQVAPGESWEVCENTNYTGRCVVVSGAERDLRRRGMNDTITSLRRVGGRDRREGFDDRGDRGGPIGVPRPTRGEIVLFDRPGYRGTAQSVTDASAGLGPNRAQSAQILGGVWELCDGPRWSGRCVRISSSVPDLAQIGLDAVASARPLDPRR
ncbi:MAG: beta/gamma crystallin-related protein [Acidobacteriota bacterium]